MDLTIHKYTVLIQDSFKITMPKDAKILAFQVQNDVPIIWAEVDKDQKAQVRYFEIFGTGHTIYMDMGVVRQYIGTIQMAGGSLVWHLYERLS